MQPSASAPAPIGMEKAADQAHDDVVAGTVLDTNGDPLAGVTIQQRGTQNKTVTDIEGRYTIRLKAGAARTLTFSYVGMTTQTLAAKGSMLRVVMKEDAHSLQDIVVVGAYGTAQKRSDLVGSAYQVNADQLKGLPQQRLDVMLDGLIPGVKIDPNTNDPGSPRTRYEVRVRGEASLTASNEPLWVIDGTPMYTGDKTNQMPGTSYTVSPLSFINPDDIASITVLKDATATSIYGADGANGVILVTTKRGRQGKMRVSVNTQYGIAHIDESTAPKVMNAQQWLTAAQAAYANAGLDMRTFPYQDNELNQYSTTDTDWRDVFYGTGTTFLTNVAVNGGSQKADYYVSGQYYQNDKTIKGNTQQRMSLASNVNLKLHKRVKLGIDLSASYNNNDLFALGREYYELLPIFSPYNADGTYRLYNMVVDGLNADGTPRFVKQRFLSNSVPEREQNDNNQKSWYVHTNFNLKYDIIDGLTYTGQFAYDYTSTLEQTYSSQKNWTGMSSTGEAIGYSRRSSADITNWTTVHRLNFNRTFGKHTVSAIAGFEAGSRDYTTMYVTGSGFINDNIRDVSQANTRDGYNSSSRRRKVSVLGQATYSFDHRYYLTVNGRKDGNSQFGSDVRWANFASIGASWNIHNEKFFHIPWINVLKLKGSYGANQVYMANMAGGKDAAYLISINRGAVSGVNYGYNVLRYAGGEWTPMVLNYLEPGNTTNNIAMIGVTVARNNVPYIWTMDDASGQLGVRIKYYDQATDSWLTLGGNILPLGFTPDRHTEVSLDLAPNGTPYVVYTNSADQGYPYLMYLDPDTHQWSSPSKVADIAASGLNLKFTNGGVGYITFCGNSNHLYTYCTYE